MTNFNWMDLPVLPIRNTVLFPGSAVPIRVGRERSLAAFARAQEPTEAKGYVLALTQVDQDLDREPGPADLHRVGTVLQIERARGDKEGGYQLVVRGIKALRVEELELVDGGYLRARGSVLEQKVDVDLKTQDALLASLKELSLEILKRVPGDTSQLEELVKGIQELDYLANLISSNLDLAVDKKQGLLECVSIKEKALQLLEWMQAQKESLDVQNEIRDKLSNKFAKHQRDSILREQLKTIREELGEGSSEDADDAYRKKIEAAGMPEEAKKVALDELKRLESIGSNSPETHVIRNYLDLLVALPWDKGAPFDADKLDLEAACAVLEADHYGLEKVKKRILQHLAVMKLKKGAKGSIILLVGPPGVGKTSLGQSIAKTLGRKFVRASLGGVRDDSEIRGHRRTYVGAMPGRIIQSIKRAGENNPVMMLDEIDKLGRGFQGDPASALLEVLDPEQNATFHDHYLDVAFDLSKVTFIATANSLETIPLPLLDRMEVIEVTGYTSAEKLHIAKRHLLPKQLEEHGLSSEQMVFADEAMSRLITHYTREAGVRDLQRQIAAVVRGATEKVLAKDAALPVRVDVAVVEEALGPERFVHETANRLAAPGVVTGLAWTPVGGEILFIESQLMPGSGKLMLTGQLGDVMKESAQIALSLVRSRVGPKLPGFDFEKKDIHIHVPSGAIPKDGPSAGVTLLTSLASLFSGRTVSPKLAMTGEITLRGAVTPVGGIKEKVMAAHRAGIERIILCKRNEKDLRDVPEEVKSAIQFEIVETVDELLKAALGIESDGGTQLGVPQELGPQPLTQPSTVA